MTSSPLSSAVAKIFDVLNTLDTDDRNKVINSVLALFGDAKAEALHSEGDVGVGRHATRWIDRHNFSRNDIEQVFHLEDGRVELIAHTVPGATKKEQTQNAYLLTGIRALLESDAPSFADSEALAFCKRIGCHDKNNHTANRRSLGNRMTGARTTGFTLPTPGLDAAADVVRQLAAR